MSIRPAFPIQEKPPQQERTDLLAAQKQARLEENQQGRDAALAGLFTDKSFQREILNGLLLEMEQKELQALAGCVPAELIKTRARWQMMQQVREVLANSMEQAHLKLSQPAQPAGNATP